MFRATGGATPPARRSLAAVLALAFLAGLGLAAATAAVPAYNPDNLVRLHVVAHSDAPADQALKHHVRDAVAGVLADAVRTARSPAQARAAIIGALPAVEAAALAAVAAAGRDDAVHAIYGTFAFGEAAEAGLLFPAGRYEAVKVTIGAGRGRNWWCVLYPGLCLVERATGLAEGSSLTFHLRGEDGQVILVTEEQLTQFPGEVRYWVLEWLRRAPAVFREVSERLKRSTLW